MDILPVSLEFVNLEPGFNAKIVLQTPGVEWSIGGVVDDQQGLGFSCNATVPGEFQSADIKNVELTRSTISIATGTASSFTLTAALCISSGVQMINGYCTINNEARVYMRFGAGPLLAWRQGIVSANLPTNDPQLRLVNLSVSGLTPSCLVVIEIADWNAGAARWTLGAHARDRFVSPFSVASSDRQPLNVAELSMKQRAIRLRAGAEDFAGSNITGDLLIDAYIERLPVSAGSQSILAEKVDLVAFCNEDITVIARMPGKRPQYLTNAPRTFSLA
jgi:hypothetical protein